MFPSLSIEAIVEQAAQVAAWFLGQLPAIRQAAWDLMWEQSPWWFRVVIVLGSLYSSYLLVRRWVRVFR